MAYVLRIDGDALISGNLDVTTISNLPANSVKNASVQSGANIDADKLQHREKPIYFKAGTAASETAVLFIGTQDATIVEFGCGSVTAAVGDSTVTVDLKKDGTTCLSSVVTLDNANAAYTPETGTLSVTSVADTDVLTVVITATVGTGTLPTGLYCYAVIDEDGA